MRPKIAEVCLSPDKGGLELYMVRAANALQQHTNVIGIINQHGELAPFFDADVEVVTVKRMPFYARVVTAFTLARLIDRHAIDIVHVHWTKDLFSAVMAKLMANRRVVIAQTRNMTMTRFKDDWFHRFIYKHIDLMLPVTFQVKEQIERFVPKSVRPRVETLYMGTSQPPLLSNADKLALRASLGVRDGALLVGMVGRIEEGKGQHLLIDAVTQLKRQGVHVRVVFVGHAMQASYLERLKMHVEALGLSQSITFEGFMPSPNHFMQCCDVVVLATRKETFGLVLIEAMAAQTAVIGADSGGVLEIIEHEKNGLLFTTGSSEDLAKRIAQLHENSAFKEQLASQGYATVKTRFDATIQFEALQEALQRCYDSSSAR